MFRLGVFQVQSLIFLVLAVAAFITEVFAFIDALRHQPQAYVAAGKQTKQIWLLILGIAMLVGFVATPFAGLSLIGPLGFLSLAAFVAAAVYLADVRPALRAATGRGGGGSHMGPYGPW